MNSERNLTGHFLFRIPWLLFGLALGLHFPDIDNRLQLSGLLVHRSILTHGFLLSLLLFWFIRNQRDSKPKLRLFIIGLSLAFAVHLCFDFFPKAWIGFALIHIPFYGRTSGLFSQLWILLSLGVCLYLAFVLVRRVIELLLSIGSLIFSFFVSVAEEGSFNIWVLLLLTILASGTMFLAIRGFKGATRG
jgi:hypothetical protein